MFAGWAGRWLDIQSEGGGDGECCPQQCGPGLELLSVCGPAPASAYLKASCPGRAGRRGTGRPARSGSPRSLVTAWHSPGTHHHRHTGTRTTAAGLKGTRGPGAAAAGVHSAQRTAHSPHLWCVGVSPPGVFPLLVVAVCLGPAPPRRLEKALDVADTAPLLGWAEKLADWAGRGRHTTPMINDDGTVPLLLAMPGPALAVSGPAQLTRPRHAPGPPPPSAAPRPGPPPPPSRAPRTSLTATAGCHHSCHL